MRSNISQGMELSRLNDIKDCAEMEGESLKHLYHDASKYISKALSIYMDETYGRDNYMNFFKLVNQIFPFLLMNDYRLS